MTEQHERRKALEDPLAASRMLWREFDYPISAMASGTIEPTGTLLAEALKYIVWTAGAGDLR